MDSSVALHLRAGTTKIHVLLGLEAIQSTCACAHIIFASFTPLKSIHHLLHASTDLSSLLLLMCVPPGTTRGAGWGCALCFPWVRGTPISGACLKGAIQERMLPGSSGGTFRIRHAQQVLPSLSTFAMAATLSCSPHPIHR